MPYSIEFRKFQRTIKKLGGIRQQDRKVYFLFRKKQTVKDFKRGASGARQRTHEMGVEYQGPREWANIQQQRIPQFF